VRILLDECVDRRLARDIIGHEVKTAAQMGWAGKSNGDLLTVAEAQFEVFVTTDRNLFFQQNLARFRIAVLILTARSNRLEDLRPLVPDLLKTPPFAKIGEAKSIGI
jgi:predicted nuclease of predicted toxin-antitoxin system